CREWYKRFSLTYLDCKCLTTSDLPEPWIMRGMSMRRPDLLLRYGLLGLLVVGSSGCANSLPSDGCLSCQHPASVTVVPSAIDSKSRDASQNGKEGDSKNDQEAPEPAPRTLPQALARYVHRLPSCWQCPTVVEDGPAAGKREQNGEEKKQEQDDSAKEKGEGNGREKKKAGTKKPDEKEQGKEDQDEQ